MYHNFLIATDGSDLAKKAVDHGLMLAKETGASVIFVTVTENWSAIAMGADATRGLANPTESYEATATGKAQSILTAAKSAAEDVGVECEIVHVADRHPAEGIIETANAKGCDLIVMASHGLRGLNRLVLGSQTTEVLAYSKLPVLVLR